MARKLSAEALCERETAINGFLKECKTLEDPRSKHGRSYTLSEIFLLVLCAQTCGFESLREYETYGEIKLSLLRRFLPYAKGIPSKSTISRVLALFSPRNMEMLLIEWMKKVVKHSSAGTHIAIDGKTHRGVRQLDDRQLHLVGAYDTAGGLVLGQEKVNDKSNEITAIPKLLEALYIKGQIISIDAMGCQKDIVKKIRTKKADYVLALKGNQHQLHDDISLYFASKKHLSGCDYCEDLDKGHGRFEQRQCYLTQNTEWIEGVEKWKDLKTIVMVKNTIIQKGHESQEIRYFISSLVINPKKMLNIIRRHWGIESMHWCLDMIFREDDRIIWNRNFAQNEAIIRRLSLNLLKQFQQICKYRIGKSLVAIKTIRKILIANDDSMAELINCLN